MTELRDYFDVYPQKLKVSTLRPDQWCYRDKQYFAVQGKPKDRIDLPVAWKSSGDQITVFEGDPALLQQAPREQALRPVYRLAPDGPPLVLTGLVFARFEEGVVVEDRRRQIADAGFEIASIPPYAPHSAWLTPAGGEVAPAPAGIAALEALPDIVNVEPQLLGPRVQR